MKGFVTYEISAYAKETWITHPLLITHLKQNVAAFLNVLILPHPTFFFFDDVMEAGQVLPA